MIDTKSQEIRPDDDQVYSNMEDLADELPDSSPRFILLSYPLTLVLLSPFLMSFFFPAFYRRLEVILAQRRKYISLVLRLCLLTTFSSVWSHPAVFLFPTFLSITSPRTATLRHEWCMPVLWNWWGTLRKLIGLLRLIMNQMWYILIPNYRDQNDRIFILVEAKDFFSLR